MKFLDTTVPVYSHLETDRDLEEEEKRVKERAREIEERIDDGEKVMSSLVHFSEFVNVLESNMEYSEAREKAEVFLDHPNVVFLEVGADHYQAAVEIADRHDFGLNDALAVVLMKKSGIAEIYSFDRHFDEVEGIERVP